MAQAGESDGKVIQRLNDNEGAFARLTPDAVASQLPRLQAPLVAVGPADPAVVVASMRRNMEALDALSSERAGGPGQGRAGQTWVAWCVWCVFEGGGSSWEGWEGGKGAEGVVASLPPSRWCVRTLWSGNSPLLQVRVAVGVSHACIHRPTVGTSLV